jgi:UDP-glucose 4-epimerase
LSLVKFFDVYGDGRPCETDVVTKFAARLSRGLSPIIHGEGLQTRDFISVDDVVDGILLSIKAMKDIENNNLSSPLVFNIGTGIPKSINQLAQKMIGLFGLDLRPSLRRKNRR